MKTNNFNKNSNSNHSQPTWKAIISIAIFYLILILISFGLYLNANSKIETKIKELASDTEEMMTENFDEVNDEIEELKQSQSKNQIPNQLKNQITSLDHLTSEHDKKINQLLTQETPSPSLTETPKSKPNLTHKKVNENPDVKLTDLSKCPSFKQLIGFKEEREAADRFLTFLNNIEDFQGIGEVDVPTGILLHGVPGTGKTTFAQALAKEANLPFFDISSSMFSKGIIGEAPKLVRDLFETARAEAQNSGRGAIIFVDECEEVFKDLAGDTSNFNKDTANVVNEFKAQMTSKDNDPSKPVLVIGATNHLHKIDEAIKSRFSYVIEIKPGNFEDRKEMLKFMIKKRKNPYSDEAKDYLLNVVNKSLDYLPPYKPANRILTNILKETASTFGMTRKQTTPKREQISIEDVKHAYHLRVWPEFWPLEKAERELKASKPEEFKPEGSKPVESKPEDKKPSDAKPEDFKQQNS